MFSLIHECSDSSDCTVLYKPAELFIKPLSRVNISIQLPILKRNSLTSERNMSSWDIMEKIRLLSSPEEFISLKVVKNTLEFIRFEGDLNNRAILKSVITKLNGKILKLTGFKTPLKIGAAEAKVPFPTKYDWDSFFRDAHHMNEMKPGERPDTVHLQNIPCKWFSETPSDPTPLPSLQLFRKIWSTFGEIRLIDIPRLDPYRSQIESVVPGIKKFSFNNEYLFEAYIQFKDYLSFVKCMDALRGCVLLHKENQKCLVASIKVDFDKTKHMSDESIRLRRLYREKLMSQLPRKTSDNDNQLNIEAMDKIASSQIEYKIALEQRKFLVANRKLQAIRLIDFILEKIKTEHEGEKKCKSNELAPTKSSLSPVCYDRKSRDLKQRKERKEETLSKAREDRARCWKRRSRSSESRGKSIDRQTRSSSSRGKSFENPSRFSERRKRSRSPYKSHRSPYSRSPRSSSPVRDRVKTDFSPYHHHSYPHQSFHSNNNNTGWNRYNKSNRRFSRRQFHYHFPNRSQYRFLSHGSQPAPQTYSGNSRHYYRTELDEQYEKYFKSVIAKSSQIERVERK